LATFSQLDDGVNALESRQIHPSHSSNNHIIIDINNNGIPKKSAVDQRKRTMVTVLFYCNENGNVKGFGLAMAGASRSADARPRTQEANFSNERFS
jgi:hypothetical protein